MRALPFHTLQPLDFMISNWPLWQPSTNHLNWSFPPQIYFSEIITCLLYISQFHRLHFIQAAINKIWLSGVSLVKVCVLYLNLWPLFPWALFCPEWSWPVMSGVTKRLLSVKDVVAPPHMFDNTEWKGGWKRGNDPADGALLCGQAGSRVHTEAAKGQAGEAGSQYIYPTPEQNAVRSDSGDVLIHLVSLGPLACYHLWISLFTASAERKQENGD